MTVSKINGFRAPYRSLTFREIADSQTGRNGLLSIADQVKEVVVGANTFVRIPSFTAIQNGLIFSKDAYSDISTPTIPVPFYVLVSAPTPGQIDNLIFSYAQGPTDVTDDQVLLAMYDGVEWRNMPTISIDGLIQQHDLENIETHRIGPYLGLHTSEVGLNYVTTGGSLIDKMGQHQQFLEDVLNPIIPGDPDWTRVDRILYRRPSDSVNRVGMRKFVLGGTYASTPAYLYKTTALDNTVDRRLSKTLIGSDNSAYILGIGFSSGTYTISFSKYSSNRQTAVVATTDIIAGTGVITSLDAAIDDTDTIHLVYDLAGNIVYQRLTDIGLIIDAPPWNVDTQTGTCSNPRCCIDAANANLYITYQALMGSVYQIFGTSRLLANGEMHKTPTQLTEVGGPVNNLINPDIFITPDYVVHVVWENNTTTQIYYQRWDDAFLVAIDVSPVLVSGATTYGLSTLSGGAKMPRVWITDNQVPFIAFLQDKGVSVYGMAIWTPQGAEITQLLASGENFTAYDFFVEPVFNGPTFIVSRSANIDLVKMVAGTVSFTIPISTIVGAQGVSFVRDNLGSLFVVWTEASNGGFFVKATAESAVTAYSHAELPSDILLARIVQPSDLILNWVLNGRPGSFYDFLTAHGQSVTIEWDVTPNILAIGSGLKVLDLYTNTDYTVASGPHAMAEGDALYVVLDGVTLSVTPQVLPISMLPWETDIAVLGVIKDGEFNPVLLGVAGMEQLDSGEAIIFGEDLPQTIRARLGITSETTFEAYTSTIGINASDTYPGALSSLDIMAGQNKHVRLVNLDAEWSVTAVNTFVLHSPAHVQVPGQLDTHNVIPIGSYALAADGAIIYVNINRTLAGTSTLAVNIGTMATLVPTRNTFIIARRVGDAIIIDSLGAEMTWGTTITAERSADKRDATTAGVLDLTTTVLPTGLSFTVDGYSLVNGDRVLFAHEDLDGIYQVNNVGVAIAWTKLAEFNGSTSAAQNDLCHIGDLGNDADHNIIWRYDFNNVVADTRWVPAVLSESNKLYLGLDANDVHKDGGEYQDQLFAGQLNNVVHEGDPLEKAIKRLDVRPDVVKRARVITRTNTTLPIIGPIVTIDGVALDDGDKVLFANTSLPELTGIFQLSYAGYSVTWTKLFEFDGETEPTAQSIVMVWDGGNINRTIWGFDLVKGWYRISTLENFVSVRAADFTTPYSSRPVTGPLTVDGQTILEGELVLYGHMTMNRIYRVTDVNGTINYEEMNLFDGYESPTDGSSVLAEDGSVPDVMWEYDQELLVWTYLTLTYPNKTYLGLTSPSKSGGTYVDQLTPGQTNNVVEEGDILEEAIKRLDVRPDVVKSVRVLDLTSATLPALPATVDGTLLSVGDKVLFGSATLNGIYEVAISGWSAKLFEFAGLQTPTTHAVVLVREGSELNRTIWQYDPAIVPPWHRIAGPSENIWTGPNAVTAPTFNGTLTTNDTDLAKALVTIDKYFRSMQLREHPTNKQRVIITASDVLKTDDTTLNAVVASRLLTFDGAQIDFGSVAGAGNIYASDGITIIGTFPYTVITSFDYFWYGVGLSASAVLSDNTTDPLIVVDKATSSDSLAADAAKPKFTSEFIIGAVQVQSSGSTPDILNIYQSDIVQVSLPNIGYFSDRVTLLEAIVALHTTEILDLQTAIASILANVPKRQVFITAAGQTIFNLTEFTVENDNTRFDIDVYLDGRWQPQDFTGTLLQGAYRKNSTTQLETSEPIPVGRELIVLKRDSGGIFSNTEKVQKFIAGVGGQYLFTLDPVVFSVSSANTDLDADYFIEGRWQPQSILGNFSDGSVRKNSTLQIETSELISEGEAFYVVRRTLGGTGGGGGGGGGTDLENITVPLGFVTPLSVGTLAKPAASVILHDTVTTDIWRIEVASGILQIVKIN